MNRSRELSPVRSADPNRRWRVYPGGMVSFVLAVSAAASVPAELPPRVLLLDAALSASDLIAVGERGTILRSTDHARTWRSASSPVRATLTGVTFAPTAPQLGWAVGHDAIILATANGGQSWTKQFQGENLQDSLLDVVALDAQHVIAIGAYGLFLRTVDAGRTWRREKITDDDFHFNRISRGPTGTLYLAGEHGTLLRSADDGAHWSAMGRPYDGSFYGVLPLERRLLIAYGLRGHVFRSTDDGETWQAVAVPEPVLLATAVRARNGALVFAGQARTLLVSRDGTQPLASVSEPPATAIAELLVLPTGDLLALGEAGPMLMPPP